MKKCPRWTQKSSRDSTSTTSWAWTDRIGLRFEQPFNNFTHLLHLSKLTTPWGPRSKQTLKRFTTIFPSKLETIPTSIPHGRMPSMLDPSFEAQLMLWTKIGCKSPLAITEELLLLLTLELHWDVQEVKSKPKMRLCHLFQSAKDWTSKSKWEHSSEELPTNLESHWESTRPGTISLDLWYWMIGVSEISRPGNMFLLVLSQPKTALLQFLLGSLLSKPFQLPKWPLSLKTQLLLPTSRKSVTFPTTSLCKFTWRPRTWKKETELSQRTISTCIGAAPNNCPIIPLLAATCNLEIWSVLEPSADQRSTNSAVCLNSLGEESTALLFPTDKHASSSRMEIRSLSRDMQSTTERRLVSEIAKEQCCLPCQSLNITHEQHLMSINKSWKSLKLFGVFNFWGNNLRTCKWIDGFAELPCTVFCRLSAPWLSFQHLQLQSCQVSHLHFLSLLHFLKPCSLILFMELDCTLSLHHIQLIVSLWSFLVVPNFALHFFLAWKIAFVQDF